MHKRLSRGFTIVEIATVIFIIALLAVLTLVVFNNVQAQSRDTSRANDMAILGNLLERYYDKNGQYPPACGSPTCSSGSSLWAYSAPDTISVSSTLAQMSTIFGQTVGTIDPQLSGSQTPIIGQWYTTSNAPGYIYRGGQTNTPPNSSAVTIYLIKLIESGSSRQCTVNVTINGTSGTDTAGYVLTYYAESTKTWNVYFGKHGAKPFIDPSSTAGFCQAMN